MKAVVGGLGSPVVERKVAAWLAQVALEFGAEEIGIEREEPGPGASGTVDLFETGLAAYANLKLPNYKELLEQVSFLSLKNQQNKSENLD